MLLASASLYLDAISGTTCRYLLYMILRLSHTHISCWRPPELIPHLNLIISMNLMITATASLSVIEIYYCLNSQ